MDDEELFSILEIEKNRISVSHDNLQNDNDKYFSDLHSEKGETVDQEYLNLKKQLD